MKNFLSTSLKITFFLIFANFATVFAYFESGITEIKHFITRVSTKEKQTKNLVVSPETITFAGDKTIVIIKL